MKDIEYDDVVNTIDMLRKRTIRDMTYATINECQEEAIRMAQRVRHLQALQDFFLEKSTTLINYLAGYSDREIRYYVGENRGE